MFSIYNAQLVSVDIIKYKLTMYNKLEQLQKKNIYIEF